MNEVTKRLRLEIARMIKRGGEGHIPSSFSIVDIIYVLYKSGLRKNGESYLDRFILSKGHGAAALYVTLSEFGIIESDLIAKYGLPGSRLGGHPDKSKVPGIEANTGSLGHGMPYAVGLALGSKIRGLDERIFCLVGDGECQEGTIWEAANIATNQELGNLTVIVDWNGSAAQLQPIENLVGKWEAFGFEVVQVNGNSVEELEIVFNSNLMNSKKPKLILAKTVKGFGVSFLQGHGQWHHKMPNDTEMLQIESELSQ